MVDKGCDLQFNNGKCDIINSFGIEIASGTKTKGNIFHFNVSEKSCFIAQIDESWLSHRRMCHVNFDCIIRISSNQVVRYFPKTVKPVNSVCKEC